MEAVYLPPEITTEDEEIKYINDKITLKAFGTDIRGTLVLTSRKLLWLEDNVLKLQMRFNDIVLHAISRDPTLGMPCIFTQVKIANYPELQELEERGLMKDVELEQEEEVQEEADPQEEKTAELLFIPEEEAMLKEIFDTFTICSQLNPDPEDEEDALSGDDIFTKEFFEAQEQEEVPEEDRFEDA